MTSPLRALIVDDEPLARQRLRRLLAALPDVDVVGEAEHAGAALGAVRELRPDLLFLDVQMPELDGFALADALGPAGRPYLIFVTAHADAAARAFDAEATDFVVKPVEPARLARAVERARRAVAARLPADADWQTALRATLAEALGPARTAEPALDRFAVQIGRRVLYVPVGDVDWIEAEGNYARLHVGRQTHLVRITMQRLEEVLDQRRFVRIHRSTIVRLDAVKELVTVIQGEYRAVLHDGTALDVMRAYRHRLPGLPK